MSICCCSLAGTAACRTCSNNYYAETPPSVRSYTTTDTAWQSYYRPGYVRKGRWEQIVSSTRSWKFRCSECGGIAYYPVPKYFTKGCGYKFCPNCGASMENRETET